MWKNYNDFLDKDRNDSFKNFLYFLFATSLRMIIHQRLFIFHNTQLTKIKVYFFLLNIMNRNKD